MKKRWMAALALIVCTGFLLGITGMAAEKVFQSPELDGIDPNALSTEALTELYNGVREEMMKRGEIVDSENRIGRGDYEVGRDIRAGNYVFECAETDISHGNSYDTPDNYIDIYMTIDGDRECIFEARDIEVGKFATFNLEKGMRLIIGGCSGILEETSPSWAP